MKKILKKTLCKLGIHNWIQGYSGSTITPIAEKCTRCNLVRVFRLWGFTYHKEQIDEKQS